MSNILHRHGLTKAPGPRRIRADAPAAQYGTQPNEVWCADFKGWWLLGNGARCAPLTITDASSRYLIRCHALSASTASGAVQPVFTAAFREYGLPAALRTDNGPPFASTGLRGLSALSVWWLKLGIALDRIRPGHPEENGRHERMHRTLKEHMGVPARHLPGQQQRLCAFRQEYNHERPHEALGFAVPAACYTRSARAWSDKPPGPLEYPDEWETRAVRSSGQMKWNGEDVQITAALAGERIGLQPAGDGVWQLYFGSYALGRFDERTGRIKAPARPAPAAAAGAGASVREAGGGGGGGGGGAGGKPDSLRSPGLPPAPRPNLTPAPPP